VTRRVRIQLRKNNGSFSQQDTDRITEIVASEIIQSTRNQR
jgi:hypothetical protein